jgi:enoyl-CoA hydratase
MVRARILRHSLTGAGILRVTGMTALVTRHDADGVALLTLDRPDKRNALSIELRVELADALAATAGDYAVGAVVLTGAGTAFCSGMDTTQFGGDRAHKELLYETSTRLFELLASHPKPTVAAVNGPAIAGGFALALLCDLRIAAPGARFGFPELGRHIPPSYAAARATLAPAVARDLCLTGRVIDADEALRLGVVSRIGELGDALDVATTIAGHPRDAIAAVKRRIALEGEATWAALLADEQQALRAALLGA